MEQHTTGLISPLMEVVRSNSLYELEGELRRAYLDYAISVIVRRSVKTLEQQHGAISNMWRRYVHALEQDIDLRISVRSALGMSQSPPDSEMVERCELWKVWDQPKPRLSYLLCQKARAPPGDIGTQHDIQVVSRKFLLNFANLFSRCVPACVPRCAPTKPLKFY